MAKKIRSADSARTSAATTIRNRATTTSAKCAANPKRTTQGAITGRASPQLLLRSSYVPKLTRRLQGAYYKSFGSPVLKCFLGALLTYQIAYYAWLKLETVEEQYDKAAEISDLQQELREAMARQKHVAKEKVGQAVDAVGEVRDRVVEGVREGADEAARATGAVGRVAKGGWWPW